MLASCLHGLSKLDLKPVPDGSYRNLNSLHSSNEQSTGFFSINAGWQSKTIRKLSNKLLELFYEGSLETIMKFSCTLPHQACKQLPLVTTPVIRITGHISKIKTSYKPARPSNK